MDFVYKLVRNQEQCDDREKQEYADVFQNAANRRPILTTALRAAMLSIEMVSRFCRLIHHLDATAAAYVVVALFGGRTLSTRPAKLILTECTCHVVAAAVFLDVRPAHRTV